MRAFYARKRVLVTGHTGFKGSWLSEWLLGLGATVRGYALDPSTDPSLFEATGLAARMDSVIGDVRNAEQLTRAVRAFRPQVVFHLAAQALVGASYTDPVGTYATNVQGTVNLLEACRDLPGLEAIVVVTSDKCYENRRLDRGYREDDPLGGSDPYSASKGAAEIVAASWRRSFFKEGPGLATARAGNVIGGGDFTPGRLVPDILGALAEGRSLELRYPGALRPWQHVLEPLEGYLQLGRRLAEDPKGFGEGWNFGPAEADARPVRDVVALCARYWGKELSWHQAEAPAPEAEILRLDASKARERLGWTPRWDLERALEATVVWQRGFLAGKDAAGLMREQIAARERVHV